jgi:hypothetical protein
MRRSFSLSALPMFIPRTDGDPLWRERSRPLDMTPEAWTLAIFGEHKATCTAGPYAPKRHAACDCGLSDAIAVANRQVPQVNPRTWTDRWRTLWGGS